MEINVLLFTPGTFLSRVEGSVGLGRFGPDSKKQDLSQCRESKLSGFWFVSRTPEQSSEENI
jgi:hypothetical protein